MPYMTTSQYPAVRQALDVTITEAQLPDTVIASAPFHPAAEAEVATRLGAQAAAAVGSAAATRATIYLTAARLVRSLPMVTRRTLLDTGIGYQHEEPQRRIAALRRLAAAELTAALEALGVTITGDQPTVFTLAPGHTATIAEGTEVPTT